MKTIITKTVWKGIELVDIRKYFFKDGELRPSKKGVSLTPKQFEILLSEFKDVNNGSFSEFEAALPFELEEKYLLSSKLDVEYMNGVIKIQIDPEIANNSIKESSELLIKGIQELSAENDLDPKLTIQKIFRYL